MPVITQLEGVAESPVQPVSYTHLDVYKRQILRTYCHHQQKKLQEYLAATEEFLNLAYHLAIGITPYSAMYEKPPPREIKEIIEFPMNDVYKFDKVKFYNKVA